MKTKFKSLLLLLLFATSLITLYMHPNIFAYAIASSDDGNMTVHIDKYLPGYYYAVSGNVGQSLNKSQVTSVPIQIKILDPRCEYYKIYQTTADANGNYSYTLYFNGNLTLTGKYRIIASYDNRQAMTDFEYQRDYNQPVLNWKRETFSVVPEDNKNKTFAVFVDLTKGTVKNITMNTTTRTIEIALTNAFNAGFTIGLPRNLIDSRAFGPHHICESDANFIVLIDGKETSYIEPVVNDTTRVLRIYGIGYPGQHIHIIGAQIAPEFSSFVSGLLMTAGIVGATGASIAIRRKRIL